MSLLKSFVNQMADTVIERSHEIGNVIKSHYQNSQDFSQEINEIRGFFNGKKGNERANENDPDHLDSNHHEQPYDTKSFHSDIQPSSPESIHLASAIDHTLLKPEATREEIQKACQEAIENRFASVCVNSSQMRLVSSHLKNSTVKPIAVVGFPLGAMLTSAKAFEAREAVRAGAREIDMVIHIGALKDRDYQLVLSDIQQVVKASHPYPVKVILETSKLTDDEKVFACVLAKAAGAAFVKTSTGFGGGGATVSDIRLMRETVGPQMGVKASGGIRTYKDALEMIQAGANRLGTSASVSIVTEEKDETSADSTSTLSSDSSSSSSDPSSQDSRY